MGSDLLDDEDRRKAEDRRQGDPDRRVRVFPRRLNPRVEDEEHPRDRRTKDKHHSNRRKNDRRTHEEEKKE